MNTLLYLIKLIFSLVLGVVFGNHISKKTSLRIGKIQVINLYILLFFMGINTGSIEGILSQLDTIGSSALLVSFFNVIGSAIVGLLAFFFIERRKKTTINKNSKIDSNLLNVTSHDISKLLGENKISKEGKILLKRHRIMKIFIIIKEPLLLISIIVLGVILKLFTGLFTWFNQSIITYLLFALLFFTGVSIVNSNLKIKEIFSSPWLLLLPVWTILGTYLGALFIPFFTNFTIKESLGISSGFGWYSLSGIMITDLGHPFLGSISFLSNVFRESLTFFLVPLLSKFGMKFYYSSVCSGGATTMDVTLPILSSHYGASTMVPNMYHGIIMTLLVPFLIPLFF